MSDQTVVWAIVCFAVAIVLILIEFFIPSGGLIGLGAAVAAVAGIVLLFQVNTWLGLIGAIVCVAALPFIIAAGLKIFPNTPVYRWLVLANAPARAADARSIERGCADGSADRALVGQEGEALTDLRPVGTCLIAGRRRECLAEGGVIPAGSRVRVTLADGMQVKVRVAG